MRIANGVLTIGFALVASPVFAQTQATIVRDKAHPAIVFAAGEIEAAMKTRGFRVTQVEPSALARQTARVQVVVTTIDAKLPNQPIVSGPPGANKELRQTIGDIKAMAWLGRYYADKIRGAVDLYRHQKSGDVNDLDRARASLQSAASHWRTYADLWSAQYVGQVLTRMGLTPVDIKAIQTFVDRDIPAPATR